MKSYLLSLFVLMTFLAASLLAGPYSEAITYYQTGKLDLALQSIDSALVEQDNAAAHELKGRIYAKMSKPALALQQFERVIELDPKRGSVHYFIGEVFFEQERWSEAFGAYRYALELDSEYRAAILKMIYCQIIMENYPIAHRWLTTLDPTNDLKPDYYFARAAMAFATDTPDQYVSALRQARTIYSTQVFNRYEPDLLRVVKQVSNRKKQPATSELSAP
jgi:tetratricopeptide (TPR) repeat protein